MMDVANQPRQLPDLGDLPPLGRLARDLLIRAIQIGAGRPRKNDEPYADWTSLLAAFVLDEVGEDTCNLMRWLERRNIIEEFHVLSDFRARRDRARQRIRAQALPEPVSDGWFTGSVREVLKEAARLLGDRAVELRPIHILAATVLPTNSPHEADLALIVKDRSELVRLVTVRALENAQMFDRRRLYELNPASVDILGANEAEPAATFLDLCAVLASRREESGAPFLYPYVAALHLLETTSSDRYAPLRAFMDRQLSRLVYSKDRHSRLLANPRAARHARGRGIATLDRARRIAARVAPNGTIELPHIVSALFAASDDLPPRAVPARDPESVETLESLLEALQRSGETEREWADLVLGPAKRTPIVRDMGERDLIDFDRFARPFASLIADKELSLPLAISVFGQWGAGKSTFMERVEKHARSLANRAARHEASGFAAGIVQIKFNAWHYNDVNLWASLVDHIFTELDAWVSRRAGADAAAQLLNRLATPRQLTLEATDAFLQKRRDQLSAKRRLEQAERDLDSKKAAVKPNIGDIAKAIGTIFDKELNEAGSQIGAAARQLGLDGLKDKPDELLAAVDTLKKQVERGRGLGQALLFRLGGWRQLAVLLTALLVIPIALVALKQGLADALSWKWLTDLSTSLVAASTFLTTATAVVLRATAKITPALHQLDTIKQRLDAAVQAKAFEIAEQDEESKKARDELVAADAAVQRARIDLDAANEQLAQEYASFSAETGSQRLKRFIRERAADGTYAKHLGLLATIRKDFAQLAALLKPPKSDDATRSGRLNYEIAMRARVRQAGWDDTEVLPWSEDLANLIPVPPMPDVAAEKLMSHEEASRLLDTTRPAREAATSSRIERIVLYIDDLDRCSAAKVMQVLEAVHVLLAAELFVVVVGVDLDWLLASVDKSREQIAASGAAERTALAFLEKIFQIPFWVPGMNPTVRKAIIREALPQDAAGPEETSSPEAPPDATGSGPGSRQARDASSPIEAEAPVLPLPSVQSVSLQRAEVEALYNAASIAGDTPRRLKRLARSYLLLRASLPEPIVARLEVNREAAAAIAFLLAASSAEPQTWPTLQQKISEANTEDSLGAMLAECGIAVPSDLTLPPIEECRRWTDEVARFSFAKLELGTSVV